MTTAKVKGLNTKALTIIVSIGLIGAFFGVGCGFSGHPDVSITDWGAPPWTTDDIYAADNKKDEVEINPIIGQYCYILALVDNEGDEDAKYVRVEFFYAPYGVGYQHEDFLKIGQAGFEPSGDAQDTEGTPTLTAETSDVKYGVKWEIDPDEDNNGKWPATVENFVQEDTNIAHLCVKVEISCKDQNKFGIKDEYYDNEINTNNNSAQNNFANVAMVEGDSWDGFFRFLVANPEDEGTDAKIVIEGAPEDWTVEMKSADEREIDLIQSFDLEKDETKLAACTIHTEAETIPSEGVEISASLYIGEEREPHSGITFKAIPKE